MHVWYARLESGQIQTEISKLADPESAQAKLESFYLSTMNLKKDWIIWYSMPLLFSRKSMTKHYKHSRSKCDDWAKFKHLCKNNFKIESIGARNFLYCSKNSLPVTTKGELLDTFLNGHLRVSHMGRDKTFDELKKNYAWVNLILFFLHTCQFVTPGNHRRNPKLAHLSSRLDSL